MARLLLEMSEEVDGPAGGPQEGLQAGHRQDDRRPEMVSRIMKDLGLRGIIEETDSGVILREKIYDL